MKPFLRVSLGLGLVLALSAQGQVVAETAEMQPNAIVDPVLQMTAWTISAPAGWHVTGTVLPPSSCDPATPPVYKATSPDGSAGKVLLPATSWAWGSGVQPKADCTLAHEAISAEDFLTYYARQSHVGFVKTLPIPETDRMTADHPGETVDQAAYLARYSVGESKKAMEELLQATIVCTESASFGGGESHMCRALLFRSYAPLAKFDAMLPTFRAMKASLNQSWMTAWTDAMRSRINTLYASQTKMLLQQGALAGAARMQEHQDYMATMQEGADREKIKFEAGQYQKQNNNDNFVDYIFNCQRAYAGTTRVSSGNCPDRQTF